MIPQQQLIVYRLKTNDARWKEIKVRYDRFEDISVEDWDFMCKWVKERIKMITTLNTYGYIYADSELDN